MDRRLYKCSDCGIELALYNGRGDPCSHCGRGRFIPVHPLKASMAKADRRSECQIEGCNGIAVDFYNGKMRCKSHIHIPQFTGSAFKLECERMLAEVERITWIESEMDKHNDS